MDNTMQQKVKDTINDLVGRGFMFTAYDITKVVRKDGSRVRHGEVNQVLQDMFTSNEMGLYTRETVEVGAPVQPWVYYHPYSDVANYKSDWVEQNPDQNGMKNADGDSTPSTDGTLTFSSAPAQTPTSGGSQPNVFGGTTVLSGTVTRSLNSANRVYVPANDENRLHVPPVLLRQIAQPGDAIEVNRVIQCGIGRCILIAKTTTGRRDYVVNKDGRIRLSRTITGWLDGSNRYKMSIENGNIVVAPV